MGQKNKFVAFSEAEKEQARQIDVIDFLAKYEGFTFKKVGKEYHCEQHNSLVVNADRKKWYWNSQKVGGHDAISWLQKIHKIPYVDAMRELVGEPSGNSVKMYEKIVVSEKKENVPKELNLPSATEGAYRNVYAYLSKSRGISPDIINDLMKNKQLYQDEHKNCVFVGFDDNGKEAFACVRGTNTNVQYRGDCSGSDKKYSFKMEGTDKSIVFCFESPIDAMSHATMFNDALGDVSAYKTHTRLSLSGTSDVALEQFLSTHSEVKTIVLCLDNDEAGLSATQKHTDKYTAKGYTCLSRPSVSKDYNTDLLVYLKKTKNNEITAQKSEKLTR